LPESIVGDEDKNSENKFYFILTCAHTVAYYSLGNKKIEIAKDILVIFGKQ
jgi:hypothetical protein